LALKSDFEARGAEAAELDREIAELDSRVRGELRERAEQGEFSSIERVEHDLKVAREEFDSLAEPPPETIRDDERILRVNVERAEQHVSDREREAKEAHDELNECRRRYLEVVNQTLLDYRRRVHEISQLAGVASEIQLPTIGYDDRSLDEAGIGVAFGFDAKDPLPLGHPAFSGGQQVIAGLILLMAMAETENYGFFMLDEPFAHLSLDRIDDVGRFLRSTRSQFIITAPTTLERAQFDAPAILIVLQKKRPDDRYAPTPIVATARQ
jgi:DNA repair exonuclease SbcCD ATPase subunit